MCNASNHPAYCQCGFGRKGGSAVDRGFRAIPDLFPSGASQRVTSYTHPNATCPVCGVAVFFYQSEHGGRVFFDELGPPWPKHPCTDGGRAATGKPRDGGRPFNWEVAGWGPIDDISATVQENRILEVSGSWMGRPVRLELDIRNLDEMYDVVAHVENFPFHVRETKNGQFDVALLSADLTPKVTFAYEVGSRVQPKDD